MPKFCRKTLILFSIILIRSLAYGQGASNKGTDFWLGYGKHISTGQMVVYITSDVSTTATVSIANLNFSQTVAVPANGIVAVDIPTGAHLANDGLSPNGIHITSLKPIIVYAHIYASSVSGATLVLPVNALGKEYMSINYKQISNSKGAVSWFFVVAVEDNTQVEITPSQDTEGGWEAGKTYNITLKKGEIYNVLGKYKDVDASPNNNNVYSYGDDLTGSRVKSVSVDGSCKKIAVFSGSSKIAISCLAYSLPTSGNNIPNPGAADNLIQQAYPTATWGKNFITVPQMERDFVIYRIVKSDPTAIVKINGTPISFALYHDFESRDVEQISADKPIQVVQYAVTQGKGMGCSNVNGDVGDPEMIYLNPLEQTLTDITMYSTGRFKILKHFINVVVKNEGVANFTLDGNSVSSNFKVVPNNLEYSYAQLSVTEGTHNLKSDVGFNAIAYGFGSAESYGYAAGANLTAFGIDPVDISKPNAEIQTGCVGVAYDLTLKLPYEASQLQFDSGDGNGLQIISSTSFTTAEKDGKTIYIYPLIPQITYTQAKTYNYRVVTTKPSADACGSGDEFLFDFLINPQPVADFNVVKEACLNNSISVKAIQLPNQTLTEYLWDFNGETTATTENAEYIYKTVGVKKTRLSVKSEDGCWSDVKELETEIMPLPVANFTQQNITCAGGLIQFTDQSTIDKKIISSWAWDFGDPTSTSNLSTDQNPSHIFSEVKTYNVTLIVTTDLGCADTVVKQITIHPLPVVDFETPDICLNDASAKFINKSTVADGSSMTYLWSFGDDNSTPTNNTSTAKDPSHIYTEAKVYQVTLTATSARGCVTTLTKPFTVNGSTPKATFVIQNESNLCSDQEVVFEDRASVDFGEVTKIEWIYDTSQPTSVETDNNPETRVERSQGARLYKHTYPSFFTPAQKTINVSMKAYSGISCDDIFSQTITLKAIPKVDFTLPEGCLPNGDAVFTNLSTFVGSEVGLTYHWEFGDALNSTSNQKIPTFAFKEAKSYQVTLTVTAPNGCTNSLTKTFVVKGAIANPSFSVVNETDLCSNQEVAFVDKATTAFGEISKIEWNFDVDDHPNDPQYQLVDNNPSLRNATNQTYTFTYPKFSSPQILNKTVLMRTTSGGNCVSEIRKTITLKAVPNVEFSPLNNVCAEVAEYQFTEARETTAFNGVGTYSGKGVAADGMFSPAKAGAGKHIVTYTFIGDNGCSDTKTQEITVYPTPSADAGADKIILTGGQIVLDAVASGSNITYKWTPSIGLDRDDVINPVASPLKDITYTLTVKSDQGCTIQDSVFVKVLQFPEIPNTFTPNGDGVNDTWNIKYLDSYPSSTMKIFNRYGKEVFASARYVPWDGKLNNDYLPEGMYYYIITAKNGELKYTGSVMLVK